MTHRAASVTRHYKGALSRRNVLHAGTTLAAASAFSSGAISVLGGERAYKGRLGKGHSPRQSVRNKTHRRERSSLSGVESKQKQPKEAGWGNEHFVDDFESRTAPELPAPRHGFGGIASFVCGSRESSAP